jgi:hypothetical protein
MVPFPMYGQEIFLLSTVFRPALGIIQPLIQWVKIDLTLEVMLQQFTISHLSLIFTDNLEQ